MSTTSFADELRARDDAAISQLFALRPDLLTPVPTDLSALAARANSVPSLIRALESLNKWQHDLLIAASAIAEPFSAKELVALTHESAEFAIGELWSRALLYKDGKNYRMPSNIRAMLGEIGRAHV